MKKITTILAMALAFNLNAQLKDSLILHMPLNNNANDYSGNMLNGTIGGATTTTDRNGDTNSAMQFDGVDDYIELSNSFILKPGLPTSFSMWVYIEDTSVSKYFISTDFAYQSYAGFWIGYTTSGFIHAGFGEAQAGTGYSNRRSYVANSNPLSINTWHHVTVVFRGETDMSIFVDCQEATGDYSGSGDSWVQYSSSAGRIGAFNTTASGPAKYFEGKLDEIAMWNRALTPAEITNLDFCNGDPLSANEISVETSLIKNISPNPMNSSSIIQFNPNENELNFELYDVNGKLVYIKKVTEQQLILEKGNLESGMYLYKVSNSDNTKVENGKLIIE